MRPPLRNLSPLAEPWGRWIEGEVTNLQQQADSLGLDSSNDGRINNSALDQMALNINELLARKTFEIAIGTIPSVSTVNVALPPPDGGERRVGWVTVTGQCYSAAAFGSAVEVNMSLDGSLFLHQVNNNVDASFPATLTTFSGSTSFTSPGTLSITVSRGLVVGASEFRNVVASVSYAQRA